MKLFSRFTHNRLITDALREIRATRSRFLSILVLSALAVCFLAGLRATEPDMKNSADRYLDSLRLMDLRVAATLGLTDEDIALLSEQPGVQLCQGAYTIDAMVKTGEKDSNAKVLSYTEEINCPELLEGRLPQTPEECLAEPRFLQETGLSIGDTITLDTGTGDYEDALTGTQFTIAGTANSPLYIGVERGSSTLGTGKAEYFLLLPMESFAMESYTDAYLLVDGAAELMTYSDEYDQLIQSMTDQLPQPGERLFQGRRLSGRQGAEGAVQVEVRAVQKPDHPCSSGRQPLHTSTHAAKLEAYRSSSSQVISTALLLLPAAGNTVSNRFMDTSRYTFTSSGRAKGHTPPTSWPISSWASSWVSILALVWNWAL